MGSRSYACPGASPKWITRSLSPHASRKSGRYVCFGFTVPVHVPVDRIVFTPGATPVLFSRDVNISVVPVPEQPASDEAAPPQTLASSGNLLRVHSEQNGHRIDEERLAIDAPEVDFATPAKWTITIENGDDVPLTIESVRLEMLQRNLCFEAAGNARYTLYYGDPALSAPRYDYATLFTGGTDAVKAAAGPEQPNPAYEPRPDERAFTEKHPALLWVALLAVIALLGAIALRAGKRVTPDAAVMPGIIASARPIPEQHHLKLTGGELTSDNSLNTSSGNLSPAAATFSSR